ncbi:hypothetical protein ACTHGU_21390 [Chitinophagaceae bacterium MMS25-I14]
MKQSVQLAIPSPCSQSWQEMTPDAQGRFCNHCRKSVIDFTEWSDKALYSFFENRNENVCGRFFQSQLNRPLQLPPQRHTKLYQLAVALGLSLILLPSSHIHARPKPPITEQNTFIQNDTAKTDSKDSFTVYGVILDAQKQPAINAIVRLEKNGTAKGGAITDIDGQFSITVREPFEPGTYLINASYAGHLNQTIVLKSVARVKMALKINPKTMLTGDVIIKYVRPIVNTEHPGGDKHLTGEQINHMQ